MRKVKKEPWGGVEGAALPLLLPLGAAPPPWAPQWPLSSEPASFSPPLDSPEGKDTSLLHCYYIAEFNKTELNRKTKLYKKRRGKKVRPKPSSTLCSLYRPKLAITHRCRILGWYCTWYGQTHKGLVICCLLYIIQLGMAFYTSNGLI